MVKRTLLLNSTYEPLYFLSERKALKLMFRTDKVQIIAHWDEEICWASGRARLPAIMKLNQHVQTNFARSNFSRKALVKRDKSSCMYCGVRLSASQITIDHVIPRYLGGVTSFINCVVSCKDCNNRKGNKTLEQVGMQLLCRPYNPYFSMKYYLSDPQDCWHPEWNVFVSGYQ